MRVPASTSNVGPGFDALGIAVDQLLRVRWQPAERNEIVRLGAIAESVLPSGSDPILRGMRRAARLAAGTLPPGRLEVESSLPPARGLGLSGAGLVAGLLIGSRLTGDRLGPEELLEEAISLDGHPENATASMRGGAHWSVQDSAGGWLHHPVDLHRDLRFLVVLPPYPLSTKRAREVLPASVAHARAAAQAARTPILLEGLRTLDPRLLRIGLADELHVATRLRQLTGAQAMLEFAARAGALGATLSGAGSGLLILTRAAELEELEVRLARRVKRLWGEAGAVIRARPARKGAELKA